MFYQPSCKGCLLFTVNSMSSRESDPVLHLQGGSQQLDLPKNEKTDICTIMYTSGTTGDPKGVMISNESIITLIAGVDRLLDCMNEKVMLFQFSFTHYVGNVL